MAKQIKSYIAKLQEIQPSPGTDLAYWNWRCQYIGMEGVLMLMKSEHKNPGELFLKMLSSDGRYLKTSYGTVELDKNHLVFTTKQSKYRFFLTS